MYCYNPRFGLTTKAKACEGAGQERSLGVTFCVLEIIEKSEGMNHHIPKWTLTLGVGVRMDSQIFKRKL
jgi:hypothetical protein